MQDALNKSKLLVGALSWLLYDIAFFGTTLFTPRIVQSIVCPDGANGCSVYNTIAGSAATFSCALPGMLIAVACIKRCGCRLLNMAGFLVLTVLFLGFGITFIAEFLSNRIIKLILLGL